MAVSTGWLHLLLFATYFCVSCSAARIVAIFSNDDFETMSRVFYKTLSALNKESRPWLAGIKSSRTSTLPNTERFVGNSDTIEGVALSLNETNAENLCNVLVKYKPVLVLALVEETAVFRVSLAAALFDVPVIGLRSSRGIDDASFNGISPLYVGLNPGAFHLAAALHHLLESNAWKSLTLILDDSPRAQTLRRLLASGSGGLRQLTLVTLDRGWSSQLILAQLSAIQRTQSLVIALCCDRQLATRLFREAGQLNMVNGQWAWVVLEGSTHSRERSNHLPVGLLGLVSQKTRISKHLMKGAVVIAHSAVRSLADSHVRTWKNLFANSCWPPSNKDRSRLAKTLYNELQWRVKEALAGRLTYDGGGKIDSALQATFDIINLVPKGPFHSIATLSARKKRNIFSANNRTGPNRDGDPEPGNSAEDVTDIVEKSSRDQWNSSFVVSADTELQDPLKNQLAELKEWRVVGNVSGQTVTFKGVIWPGGGLSGPRPQSSGVYRIATTFSPPFVMEGEISADENLRCLTGLPCLRVSTHHKDELARIFGDFERGVNAGITYNITCCYGFSIDLMENMARDLSVRFQTYVVSDGQCGAKISGQWDGVIADLKSGAAHLSFAPLSVTSIRAEVIDFSIPYFYSGLSFLVTTKHDNVPLLAFLKPFSVELWTGIFVSLNVTALAVAIYEWLSPFGLNPWGRQRTKNFSLASALWVMWGLLFSHLVAFKAPKSWPNKFLINVWGGFSVIFLASYTANIAALFAGVFSQNTVTNFHDASLLNQRVGTTRSSAADHYAFKANRRLWEHMQKYTVPTLEEGIAKLRNGSLDLLIGDTPLLDYYRANDPGCTLRTVGDVINEDTYAVGMTKGLPLQSSISALISSYSGSGYLDELRTKWYSSLPCFRSPNDAFKPQPLGVQAVAGVFILLGFGILAGCLILILEHLVYKYALPGLRRQPKGSIWRSLNMMFFSQKLYRFINCVELLSPHHAAKELMNSLRQGEITSLFQKSVKRKENEQKRRRKSKAQFYEMIQEIRRFQQEERDFDEDEEDTVTNHELPAGVSIPESDEPPSELNQIPGPEECTEKSVSEIQQQTDCYVQREVLLPVDPVFLLGAKIVQDIPPTTNADVRQRKVARHRTSISLDALDVIPFPADRRLGPDAASSSSLSSSETGKDSESRELSSVMVDRAALNRLTKEDLLLLWQAAESEWQRKLAKAKAQRDDLHQRLQSAQKKERWTSTRRKF